MALPILLTPFSLKGQRKIVVFPSASPYAILGREIPMRLRCS